MSLTEEDGNKLVTRLRGVSIQLKEEFELDTIHIFVTKTQDLKNNSDTIDANFGDGNWYSRYGSIKWWIMRQEEKCALEERWANEND